MCLIHIHGNLGSTCAVREDPPGFWSPQWTAVSLSCSSNSPWVSHSPPIKDRAAHPLLLCLLHVCSLLRGMTSYLTHVLRSVCQMVLVHSFDCFSAHLCVHIHVLVKRPDETSPLCFTTFASKGYARVCVRFHKPVSMRVSTQVRSSSTVLILRVLTVSIESSWQLKEERKIGKWGGVSMLRPLPPHSSLAEDVWIYSGNATFERNKWEGSSFLLCVWIFSSGVSLSDAVQHWVEEGESGLGSCSVLCFYLYVNVRSGCTVPVGG